MSANECATHPEMVASSYRFRQLHARKHGDFVVHTNLDSSSSAMREWLEQPNEDTDRPPFRFALSACDFSPTVKTLGDVKLSPGAQKMAQTPNAGGNSLASEVMSLEPVTTLIAAQLEKLETELEYKAPSSITDYSCRIAGHVVGVSVTRAFCWKGGGLTLLNASKLVEKKLRGILSSTANVIEEHAWDKQILHVWTRNEQDALVVKEAWNRAGDELKGNTFVLVTVSDAKWLYSNS